jgi:hypothetical protein
MAFSALAMRQIMDMHKMAERTSGAVRLEDVPSFKADLKSAEARLAALRENLRTPIVQFTPEEQEQRRRVVQLAKDELELRRAVDDQLLGETPGYGSW